MKAKEYYEKYGADLIKEWEENDPRNDIKALSIVRTLMADFYQECIDLNKLRHGSTIGALQAIAREQNEKWNALVRILEKNHSISPLMWNGFMEYITKTVPDLFPPEITPAQILEAKIAIERIQAKEQLKKDMLDAAKKLQKVEQSVKEKEISVKERNLKNAKFV